MDKTEAARLKACCKATKRHLMGQLKHFGAAHALRAISWYLASVARAFGEDDQAALKMILKTICEEFDAMESLAVEKQA